VPRLSSSSRLKNVPLIIHACAGWNMHSSKRSSPLAHLHISAQVSKLIADFRIRRNAARNRLHRRRPSNGQRGPPSNCNQLHSLKPRLIRMSGIQIDVFEQYSSTECHFTYLGNPNVNSYMTPRQLGLRHNDIVYIHRNVRALVLPFAPFACSPSANIDPFYIPVLL